VIGYNPQFFLFFFLLILKKKSSRMLLFERCMVGLEGGLCFVKYMFFTIALQTG